MNTTSTSGQSAQHTPGPTFNVDGRDFYLVRNHSRWSVLQVGGDGKTVTGPVRKQVLAKFNEHRAAIAKTTGSAS